MWASPSEVLVFVAFGFPFAAAAAVIVAVVTPPLPVNRMPLLAMFFGPGAPGVEGCTTIATTIAMTARMAILMPPWRTILLRRLRFLSASRSRRAVSRAASRRSFLPWGEFEVPEAAMCR